jgi:CubicO group peptidase (beta-lactamase class C family)
MKKILVVLSLFTALVSKAQSKQAALDSMVSSYFQMKLFNGAVLVTQGNQILLSKAYGYANKKQVPLSKESIFQIYSVTKPFTSTAILMLAQKKLLNVNDTLSKYFDFPAAHKITIRQLLSHTSGLYEFTRDNDHGGPDSISFIRYIGKKPLDFEPGSSWSYSNSGYWMLGLIIEKVTGMSYENAVKKMIFEPLQMKHSGFYFGKLEDENKTSGYRNIFDSSLTVAEVYKDRSAYAAGAIYSTTSDLLLFHKALQSGKLLPAESLQQAYTIVQANYGLGWVLSDYDNKHMVYHSGGASGYRSNFLRIPSEDICIVVLANTEMTNPQKLTDKLLYVTLGKPYFIPPVKLEPRDSLQVYTGTFAAPEFDILVSFENGRLVAEVKGRGKTLLFQKSPDLYYADELDTDFTFGRDGSSKVITLTFNMRSQNIQAKKK